MKTLVIFAHGKESGPWGSKIRHLAEIAKGRGAEVLSPDYSDLMDPDERVKRLLELQLPQHDCLILVGSSMGGYVSTVASRQLQPVGLFLMAPAFYLPGFAVQQPEPFAGSTCVVFGWRDDIVLPEYGIRFAQTFRSELHLLDGGHRLNDVLPHVGRLFDDFLQSVMPQSEP